MSTPSSSNAITDDDSIGGYGSYNWGDNGDCCCDTSIGDILTELCFLDDWSLSRVNYMKFESLITYREKSI